FFATALSATPNSLIPITKDQLSTTHYPAPFVDVLRALHDGDFYDRQAAEWETLATGDCSTDEAWFHYYKTAHYSNRFGSGSYDLPTIATRAEQVCDPDGFDLNYIRFAADEHPVNRWPYILAAHRADPERAEAYAGLAAYYEVNGMVEERNEVIKRLHKSAPIPTGVMEYNYNQLISVAENGILITNGDADTYPSWLLQANYGIRQDVLVVNVHLLRGYTQHRKKVFTDLSLPATEEAPSPVELLRLMYQTGRPVFLATTAKPQVADLSPSKLFLTGLALQYSETPVNNLGAIARHYTKDWRLDHLRNPLAESPAQRLADQLNQNYLPPLIELYQLDQRNLGSRFPEVRALIDGVAARVGMEDQVLELLQEERKPLQLASKTPGLKAKDIFKGLAFIPGGKYYEGQKKTPETTTTVNAFFLQEAEVSNADYQLFLEDLLRQRRFALIDSAAVAETDWLELLPDTLRNLPVNELMKRGHPSTGRHPVVNISHRAAELYALWLTQVYNQDEKRKDGKNVRFRLPTKEESAYAARAGKAHAPYPWGGPYYRNLKGCYLANFNTLLREPEAGLGYSGGVKTPAKSAELEAELDRKRKVNNCDDGGWLTVPVDSYFPNDFGLYNMSGNAAEMTLVEGETTGGSWMDGSYEMQIGVVTNRNLPDPSTGFRLVMYFVE
ncbi:MAG: SUMF1/EgtB/PvdO family nonheme iron enzyme, partial [Bacteroidota bacterium]